MVIASPPVGNKSNLSAKTHPPFRYILATFPIMLSILDYGFVPYFEALEAWVCHCL